MRLRRWSPGAEAQFVKATNVGAKSSDPLERQVRWHESPRCAKNPHADIHRLRVRAPVVLSDAGNGVCYNGGLHIENFTHG